MKSIEIKSSKSKIYTKSLIDELPEDSSFTVEIKKTENSATYKQQKLWFMWVSQVANSGLGQHHVQSDVHVAAKWQFVRPILLEENEVFGIIYDHFIKTVKQSASYSEYCKEFSDKWIHTNDLTRKGRVKSLDEFYKFWCIEHGVDLTEPETIGLDLKRHR